MGCYPFLGSAGMFLQEFYGNCQVKNDQLSADQHSIGISLLRRNGTHNCSPGRDSTITAKNKQLVVSDLGICLPLEIGPN